MVLTETGPVAHGYLFVAGVVALMMFLVYVFICEHKVFITGNPLWTEAFERTGLTSEQIRDLTHDDSMWYHQSRSTCVAYGGDFSKKCHRHENYCAGGDRYGDAEAQSQAVKESLDNGGEHPMCPLIYPGAD